MDYFVALAILKYPAARKLLLFLSLVVNLGFLAFFKYFGFLMGIVLQSSTSLGLEFSGTLPQVTVPVGISFYTFQTLSYTIDVYRGQIEPRRSFFDFSAYVAFFPQLVAGPIERASNLLPQLENIPQVNYSEFVVGIQLIARGLFKKLVIADNLAPLVETVFDGRNGTGPVALAGMYAFAFQIYCDFSGYTDIARGLSRWFGISLMENFRMPYFASGPADFWRRWHISLSTWLRDYLYISLGGNRSGQLRTYANLMITMVLGGLWHGPSWMFVLWGTYLGTLLVLERLMRSRTAVRGWGSRGFTTQFLLGLLMFHLTCFGWVLFRATTLDDFLSWLQRASVWNSGIEDWEPLLSVTLFASPILIHWIWRVFKAREDDDFDIAFRPVPFVLVTAAMIFAVVLLGADSSREFIYFQF